MRVGNLKYLAQRMFSIWIAIKWMEILRAECGWKCCGSEAHRVQLELSGEDQECSGPCQAVVPLESREGTAEKTQGHQKEENPEEGSRKPQWTNLYSCSVKCRKVMENVKMSQHRA